MKRNLCQALWIFALCLGLSGSIVAQSQSAEAKRGDVTHRVHVQLLVASNTVNTKTNYPASLEAVVKQLKSSLPFKTHYLVATYLHNVAEGSGFEVSDVSYAAFEPGSALAPTFLNLGISGIKLSATGDSIQILRLKFESRKRIFIHNAPAEGSATKAVFDDVRMGMTTALNVTEGVPTIVGTTTSALSDGVLVLVITVNHSAR